MIYLFISGKEKPCSVDQKNNKTLMIKFVYEGRKRTRKVKLVEYVTWDKN